MSKTLQAGHSLHALPARRARGTIPVALAVSALLSASLAQPLAAQLYAHRTLVPVPLDDTTRSVGFLPAIDYFADVQRSSGSAGDDRAWGIRLAGTAEVWRVRRGTSILVSAADEVAANSLKDGGFNPRGISWELGLAIVHRFAAFDWQVGFVHICRHEIDNTDHPRIQATPPDYVPTERTMSANGPRAAMILRPTGLGSVLGRRIHLRAVVAAESYHHKWDGRAAADTTASMAFDSWMRAQGAASAAVRLEAEAWRRSAVFVRASGIGVFFRAAPNHPVTAAMRGNHRLEAGWRMPGTGAAMEIYLATERLFDDIMMPDPRPSTMTGIGIRLSERTHF
ncbi:MAG: hypothetical protein ABR499_16485 [Gemmatimonadaceae bacterium]